MTDRQLLALAALGGVAWWYLSTHQSVNGLESSTVYDGPEMKYLTPVSTKQSLVTPSYTTSTAATNVNNLAAGINTLFNKFIGALGGVTAPGNAPQDPAYAFNGPAYSGLKVTSTPGVVPIGSQSPRPDGSLDRIDPFWGWGLGNV